MPSVDDLPGVSTTLTVAAGLVGSYVVLLVALLLARPDGRVLRETLRLLPDLLRLLRRLATDSAVPRGPRVVLWLTLAYLASPIDLVPDVLPVLGYADDAIVVALALRWVVRTADWATLRHHWPGTADGLRAVWALTGAQDPRSGVPAAERAGDC